MEKIGPIFSKVDFVYFGTQYVYGDLRKYCSNIAFKYTTDVEKTDSRVEIVLEKTNYFSTHLKNLKDVTYPSRT